MTFSPTVKEKTSWP